MTRISVYIDIFKLSSIEQYWLIGYAYKSNKIEFYWTYKIIKSNSPNDGVFISPIGPIAITAPGII